MTIELFKVSDYGLGGMNPWIGNLTPEKAAAIGADCQAALATARRVDECLDNCLDSPAEAVAKIDAKTLRLWLDYAESQAWKPRRLRRMIRAARKQLNR